LFVAVVSPHQWLGLKGRVTVASSADPMSHTFATVTGMILMPYPGWTSKLMRLPVVFRAPRTLTTSSIMTYLPPMSAFFHEEVSVADRADTDEGVLDEGVVLQRDQDGLAVVDEVFAVREEQSGPCPALRTSVKSVSESMTITCALALLYVGDHPFEGPCIFSRVHSNPTTCMGKSPEVAPGEVVGDIGGSSDSIWERKLLLVFSVEKRSTLKPCF